MKKSLTISEIYGLIDALRMTNELTHADPQLILAFARFKITVGKIIDSTEELLKELRETVAKEPNGNAAFNLMYMNVMKEEQEIDIPEMRLEHFEKIKNPDFFVLMDGILVKDVVTDVKLDWSKKYRKEPETNAVVAL
jgi:hypothetical protein